MKPTSMEAYKRTCGIVLKANQSIVKVPRWTLPISPHNRPSEVHSNSNLPQLVFVESPRKRYQLTLHLRKPKLWSQRHFGRQLRRRHLGLEEIGTVKVFVTDHISPRYPKMGSNKMQLASTCYLGTSWNTRQDFPTHCEFFSCKRTWTI